MCCTLKGLLINAWTVFSATYGVEQSFQQREQKNNLKANNTEASWIKRAYMRLKEKNG